jgi:hypothetical protein
MGEYSLCFIVAASLFGTEPARPQPRSEAAQAVVDRAIDALGGEKSVRGINSVHLQYKFGLFTERLQSTGDLWLNRNGGCRYVFQRLKNGPGLTQTFDGSTVAASSAGDKDQAVMAARAAVNTFAVCQLWNLKQSGVSLESVAAKEQNGRRLSGVRVSKAGLSPIVLWFDDKHHLLSLAEFDGFFPLTLPLGIRRISKHQVFFDDYRACEGVKVPYRIKIVNQFAIMRLEMDQVEMSTGWNDEKFRVEK